jgi:hypothetical protein
LVVRQYARWRGVGGMLFGVMLEGREIEVR